MIFFMIGKKVRIKRPGDPDHLWMCEVIKVFDDRSIIALHLGLKMRVTTHLKVGEWMEGGNERHNRQTSC